MRMTTRLVMVSVALALATGASILFVFDPAPQHAAGQSGPADTEPAAPLSPADLTEVSGMLILRGYLISNPPTFERTATTLLVNGVDVAPLTDVTPTTEAVATEPLSFATVTQNAFSAYFAACIAGGVDGLPEAQAALLSSLQSSAHVSNVVLHENFVIAYSPDGAVQSLELATDQADIDATASAYAALQPEVRLASRDAQLGNLQARLESALRAGELVVWHGIDGGVVFPAAEARAVFHDIKQIMRDPNLDRAGRIRELLPVVQLQPLAEQIADNFTAAGL